MASSLVPLSDRFCDPCMKDDKQIKARTLCYECHTLLCEPCSDYHHRLKITQDHHLIELVQFKKTPAPQNAPSTSRQTSTSFNEDELASDFLETVTLTGDTVLYRGAQVAVESTSVTTKPEKHTTSKQANPTQLKAAKCIEFSVKKPEDKENLWVAGVLCVSDNVVVIDYDNKVLKLFDQTGTYVSSTELKNSTFGITCIHDSTFATCGFGNTVCLWTVREHIIASEDVSYHVDHDAYGIHYNGTYYCVLHRQHDAITILDRQGRQVRKITTEEACRMTFTFGFDIHMDSDTNNICVPCCYENGVLCMTIEGQVLWFSAMSSLPLGITEIQGTLCVADYYGSCLHLINKGGEYVRKLLDEKDLGWRPYYICYGQNGKLYVSCEYFENKGYIISVFSTSNTNI